MSDIWNTTSYDIIARRDEDTSYNGWANRETWNVALWIGNDEGLYNLARGERDYDSFVGFLSTLEGEIAYQTPDGVAWDDPALDIDALNEMIEEL